MPLVTAHQNFPHFFNVLDPKVNPWVYTAWQGDVARQAAPRWMSRPYRLTGAGSVLSGARWSVRGLMPTIYASTDPDTLNAEYYHKGRRYGWVESDFHPSLRVGMNWKLQRVADLTQPAILAALGVAEPKLLECDWNACQLAGREALTQAIARAAFERLAEGLLVHSARRDGGVNLVYFPSHRLDGTIIETLNPAALPPDMHGLAA